MTDPRTMSIVLDTPAGREVLDGVVYLRFEAPDGHRGVLPGHEHAIAVVIGGALALSSRHAEGVEESFVATEEGIARIDPGGVVISTRWAKVARTLEELIEALRHMRAQHRRLEREARSVSRQHEVATQRALLRLQREISE